MSDRASQKSDSNTRIAFELNPAMTAEVEEVLALRDLGSKPEVFRRAFALLRIHMEAAMQKREIYMVDPKRPNDKYIITLPFNVSRKETAADGG